MQTSTSAHRIEGDAGPLLVVTDGAPGLIAGADPRRNGDDYPMTSLSDGLGPQKDPNSGRTRGGSTMTTWGRVLDGLVIFVVLVVLVVLLACAGWVGAQKCSREPGSRRAREWAVADPEERTRDSARLASASWSRLSWPSSRSDCCGG